MYGKSATLVGGNFWPNTCFEVFFKQKQLLLNFVLSLSPNSPFRLGGITWNIVAQKHDGLKFLFLEDDTAKQIPVKISYRKYAGVTVVVFWNRDDLLVKKY